MPNVFDRMVVNSNGDEPQRKDATTSSEETARADADCPARNRVAADIRQAVQELLRLGYLEETRKPELFRKTIIHESAVNLALYPLDLAVKIDTHRGITLVIIRDDPEKEIGADEQWSHPLVRRQRLTLEQSLLIAILRGAFVLHEQESGVGQRPATMAVDELLPQYLTYVEDSGSDARNETRLLNLLDQLKGYGIVSEVNEKEEFTIRPLIAHVANPESLAALLQMMNQMTQQQDFNEQHERLHDGDSA